MCSLAWWRNPGPVSNEWPRHPELWLMWGCPLPSLQVMAVASMKMFPTDASVEAILKCRTACERASGALLRADVVWKQGAGLFTIGDSEGLLPP